MENQHRSIKGYRELSPVEVALMNEIKAKAEEVGGLVEKLRTLRYAVDVPGSPRTTIQSVPIASEDRPDQRWVSIGATELQQGFMALTRAIAKPTTF